MSVTHLELYEQMDNQPTAFGRYNGGDEDDDDEEDGIPKIRIGICAMSKKTNSQPMQEILGRMSVFDFVDIFVFPDDTILNVPVEKWPICDCLISFYSKGFPLEKAIDYANLRKPFSLNDLEMQYALMDRPTMYSLLATAGIETPRHAILLRDENTGEPINTRFVETDDSVQVGDMVFHKPFVEKPVNAEDHNVYIYFPSSAGGGSQRLFRKVGNRSSVYSAESSVRKEGSYIYEDFVVTDGTDVKVYTVGPEYAHAEARKSPSLDGKVERDSQGKEIRYPVILNQYEKILANKVCNLFKQTVCGCDLLRTHGKSYVCDVNGFSFVKTSKKYYDDAAQVLIGLIVQELAPQLYRPYHLDVPEEIPAVEALNGTMLELRCVVGIIRHGDRTPKQKMKMEVRHPRFIELFKKYNGFDEHKLKLKRPMQLQEVLDIARDLLSDSKEGRPVFENLSKLHQLKSVLEMYGYFSGINRKIQFKYLGKPRDGSESSESSAENRQGDSGSDERSSKKKQGKESKESKNKQEGKTEKEVKRKESKEFSKTQDLKETDTATADEKLKVPVDEDHSLLLILKWGGELTTMGKQQALELGRAFRSIYPGGHGEYSRLSGCGLLRLHSTYRHDLKIYASDEGRVQMTAAAFAKGFLALEGELTPILVHLVRSDKNTTEMLDTSSEATKILGKVKHRLHEMLRSSEDFKDEDFAKLAPTKSHSVINAMKNVKNPHSMCAKLYSLVQDLTGQLKDLISQKVYDPRDPFLYHEETLELMMHRWTKLEKDFKLKSGQFDISLIPDIYDCIKYDVQHNGQLCLKNSLDLFKCAKAFADIVIPQEYGITQDEKLAIAQRVCVRLLRKIRGDMRHADNYSQSVVTPHRHVRTRLYFTSESHVHTVLNVFRLGKLFEDVPDEQWQRAVEFLSEVPELNYMTQIVLMLYEDPKADPQSEHRFHVEMHFSPGAKTMDDPEFLARKSPCRKRSVEDARFSTGSGIPSDAGVEGAVNRAQGVYEPQNEKDVKGLLSAEPGLTLPPDASTTDSRSTASKNSVQNFDTSDLVSVVATSLGPDLVEDEKSLNETGYEPFNDKPFDETVYAGNERPRCAIGLDNFSDSGLCEGTSDSAVTSGTSIEESSAEEAVNTKRRSSSAGEIELQQQSSLKDSKTQQKGSEGELRTKSDSDVRSAVVIPRKVSVQGQNSVKCIVDEDKMNQSVRKARPKSHSVSVAYPVTYATPLPRCESSDDMNVSTFSEGQMLTIDEEDDESDYLTDVFERQRKSGVDDDHESDELNTPKDESQKEEPRKGTEKPSSAKSDTTSERPRKVSYDLVNKQGSDEGDQLLRIVKSSPALKKGSPTRKRSVGSATSAIRAVRKLSYAISSALVVRPYSVTKSTKNSRKPPIADFYEEMTKVESLNPLRTLHNSVPLKEMDGFFDKTAGEGAETLVTPINTPSRKPPSRRLAARSAPNPVQSAEKKSSAGSEPDTEGVTDLLTEAIQKLDS